MLQASTTYPPIYNGADPGQAPANYGAVGTGYNIFTAGPNAWGAG